MKDLKPVGFFSGNCGQATLYSNTIFPVNKHNNTVFQLQCSNHEGMSLSRSQSTLKLAVSPQKQKVIVHCI